MNKQSRNWHIGVLVPTDMLWKIYVLIINEFIFGLINSRNTYIIPLFKDMSVRRKSSCKFYRNEESHYRVSPLVRYYGKTW